MPCYDPRDHEKIVYEKGHDPHFAQRARQLESEVKRLQQRNDTVVDLLCKAGRARYRKTLIPKEVLAWWDEHCKIDRARGEPW